MTSNTLLKCEYCGSEKVRVVEDIYGSGIKKELMFAQHIPFHTTTPLLADLIVSRQVWICDECVELLQ